MKIYTLIYEGFTQFEVVIANYLLATKFEMMTVGINNDEVKSMEGYLTKPHITINEIDLNDVKLLIIPGGDPAPINNNDDFKKMIIELNKKNVNIGAICSGVLHLANAGILYNKKYTTSLDYNEYEMLNEENFINKNIVIDDNIITAKANGYVDFGLELGKKLEIYQDESDYQETINYFKLFQG